MATAAATVPAKGGPKEFTFAWEGKDKGGKVGGRVADCLGRATSL